MELVLQVEPRITQSKSGTSEVRDSSSTTRLQTTPLTRSHSIQMVDTSSQQLQIQQSKYGISDKVIFCIVSMGMRDLEPHVTSLPVVTISHPRVLTVLWWSGNPILMRLKPRCSILPQAWLEQERRQILKQLSAVHRTIDQHLQESKEHRVHHALKYKRLQSMLLHPLLKARLRVEMIMEL